MRPSGDSQPVICPLARNFPLTFHGTLNFQQNDDFIVASSKNSEVTFGHRHMEDVFAITFFLSFTHDGLSERGTTRSLFRHRHFRLIGSADTDKRCMALTTCMKSTFSFE